MINKLLLSKFEIKKFINNEKRFMTYNNINNFDNYLNEKDIILNIKEKKNNLRKINSGKINKNFLNRNQKGENEDNNFGDKKKYKKRKFKKKDIYGNMRKNIIVEAYNYLDDEPFSSELSEKEEEEEKIDNEIKNKKVKKSNKLVFKDNKEEEKEKEKEEEEEKKKDEYVHPLVQLEENIKKINLKMKKRKKDILLPKEDEIKDKKSKKNLFILKKNNNFVGLKFKDIKSANYQENSLISNRVNSPAINSILNDIKTLSKLVIKKAKRKKSNSKKNKYEKHFGYEYWKENEFRKTYFHPMTLNKRRPSSIRSMSSTLYPDDNYSMLSSNISNGFKKNSENYNINDEYNYSFKINDNYFNPYSVYWTKNMLRNYNRKIKLKKRISGIPKIELMSRSRSSASIFQPTISYNVRNLIDNKNSNFFRKNNNMFGRIYNKNEIEFPFIYKP